MALQKLLQISNDAFLACDQNGKLVAWSLATITYCTQLKTGQDISEAIPGFPELEQIKVELHKTHKPLYRSAPDGLIRWTICHASPYLLIRLDPIQGDSAPSHSTSQLLQLLHTLQRELSTCSTLPDLYYRAVELAMNYLHLDRVALLLYNSQSNEMSGTFGTDLDGKIVDESHFRRVLPDNDPWAGEALKHHDFVMVWHKELYNSERQAGTGWNAITALWNNEKPFGWLVADNLFHHEAISLFQREILSLYAQVISGLITRLNRQHVLEVLVNERVADLEEARQQLIAQEKFAALGNMVAGVAHEVNTPLGNSLTGVSYQLSRIKDIENLVLAGQLTQVKFEEFLAEAGQNLSLVEKGLLRAIDQVKNFKKLAVDQTLDDLDPHSNVAELIKSVSDSYLHLARRNKVEIIINIEPGFHFAVWPGSLEQIVSNLIGNCLNHAFPEEFRTLQKSDYTAVITVSAYCSHRNKKPYFNLEVQDNGCGVPPLQRDLIFKPFFTTRHKFGGTGLGLAIAQSISTQRFNGTIVYKALDNGGSCFSVQFPEPPIEN